MNTIRKSAGNRVTAFMQVRNEADRYLETVLQNLSEFVEDIVIVDDASTDDTVKLCRSFQKVKHVVELADSHFGKEAELKVLLWKAACAEGPDWLLAVDADEIFEDRMKAGSSFPGRSGSFRLGRFSNVRFLGWNDPLSRRRTLAAP